MKHFISILMMIYLVYSGALAQENYIPTAENLKTEKNFKI